MVRLMCPVCGSYRKPRRDRSTVYCRNCDYNVEMLPVWVDPVAERKAKNELQRGAIALGIVVWFWVVGIVGIWILAIFLCANMK